MNYTSIQLCIFLGANPDEELTTSDMATKFGVKEKDSVRHSTRWLVAAGFVKRQVQGPGKPATYRAGPELLKAIGK